MAIYIIRAADTDLYKIGTAANPMRRLAELQTGSPLHLELICTVDGDRGDEQRVHRALRDSRARGEWFELAAPPTAEELSAWTVTRANSEAPVHSRVDGDLVGLNQIAERLGVPRATVDTWRHRGQLPEPDLTLGPRQLLWKWETIKRWSETTGKGTLTTDS